MARQADLIDELTYPHLDTVHRVVHVVAFDRDENPRTPERIAQVQARMLGHLIDRLERSGHLSSDDLDQILLNAAL